MKNILFLLCIMGALLACNDISDIGEDILDRDGILTSSHNDFSLKAKTITRDSVIVYRANSPIPAIRFLGNLDDPLLGETSIDFYKEFVLGNLAYEFSDTAVLDSVILSLAIDSAFTAGDHENITMDFLVYELNEQIQRTDDYSSNFSFASIPFPIGEAYNKNVSLNNKYYETLPNKEDGMKLDTLYSAEDVVRIPLSMEFGNKVMGLDQYLLEDNDLFRKTINGIKVKGLSANTMLALKANGSATRISIYYKEGDERKIAHLVTSPFAPSLNSMSYNAGPGQMSPLFNDYEKGDSVLAVSGLAGPNIQLQLGDLSGLKDKLINYAEIKVYAASNEVDTDMYPPLRGLNLYYFDNTGERVLVPDLQRGYESANVNQGIEAHFGGGLIEADSVYSYTMNISEFAQLLIEDPDISTLEITAQYKAYRSGRTIIYGPKHSKFPIEVNFYYSELK